MFDVHSTELSNIISHHISLQPAAPCGWHHRTSSHGRDAHARKKTISGTKHCRNTTVLIVQSCARATHAIMYHYVPGTHAMYHVPVARSPPSLADLVQVHSEVH